MSRYFKEAADAALAAAPESEEIRLFLARLLEDENRCVDQIWKGYLAKGQKDGPAERIVFIKKLVHAFMATQNAKDAALLLKAMRRLKQRDAKFFKKFGKVLANESVAAKEKLHLLERANETIRLQATIDEKKHLLQEWHIRSDWGGRRELTAFMWAAGERFHRDTGEWHDDWVADLTNAAFPSAKVTIDKVRPARRSMRRRRR